ncbi:VanW family protein [Nocardioides aestuarii]|uniref:VanW family protein n=1 Tax=Nocardioides aestuarii TaxID=252231 RepID=A0ABW4TKA6_9ACTN
MTGPEREKEGGRVVLLLLVGLALLAGGAYAAAYLAAGDRVPRGATVAGVAIGGQTPAEARATLEEELAQQVRAPMEVSVGATTRRLRPDDLGLAVDVAASVEAAGGGRSWDPARLWNYYTGGDELPAVLDVDDDAMTAALAELGEEVGTPARDGAVTFEGGQIVQREPRDGRQLDVEAARAAIEEGWPAEEGRPVELELVTVEPAIDAADVRAAVAEFANPAVSAPVTLLFDDSEIRLNQREFLPALRLRPQDGELVPGVAKKPLSRLLDRRISSGEPVDATVRLVGGRPRVVPAKPGVTFEPVDVERQLLRVVVRPSGEREARIEAVAEKSEVSTKEARSWKIKERVSTFTTYYPHADYRNTNIGRAGELIDGTVLAPGETFSLNGIVGERTRQNGFTEGFIISDGILVEDLGGGVSQMATTAFNAAFFAGLKDVEHKPHSFYIDRYPVGREATVAWGAVDLRFQNDTDYGVLVDAEVTPSTPSTSGVVTVSMWSTKTWDITTRTSDRYNITQEDTRRIDTPDCHANDGYGGFDVDVWRYFRRPGSDELVKQEKLQTTYTPSDTVICTNPRADG